MSPIPIPAVQNSYRPRSELDSIASNHSTVTKALEHLRGEYREALDARHRVEAQFGLQRFEQEQLQKKIESLLVEKKDLQSLISMHGDSAETCHSRRDLMDPCNGPLMPSPALYCCCRK